MEDKKSVKRQAAEARQAAYDALTIQERIARLDAKFGVGQGAKKERAKLQAKLEASKSGKLQQVRSEMSASRSRPSQATTEEANAQMDRALGGKDAKE